MKNFNDSFTFDHTVCVVDNGDYGLAFNRFTGTVLAAYAGIAYPGPGNMPSVLLVDVEEYRRAYGEYPPNDTLNTALDFGYWYRDEAVALCAGYVERKPKVSYSPPEREFRRDILKEHLIDVFVPPGECNQSAQGLRDIEIRPCMRYPCASDGVTECKSEDAEFWGLYGRTFAGPAWHIADVASRDQAYWLRAALAALLVVDRTQESERFNVATMRAEALADVKFDPEGR